MEFSASSQSPFDCLLIDLDDTLYSPEIGIGQACKKNIEDFLALKCGISAEEACSLRVELFRSHGSSLSGLINRGYEVHPDDYHGFVHGRLPYERIQPDQELRKLLLSVPQPKILFTNSDRQHAKRVLQRLGIEDDCFQEIICFETMNPLLFHQKESPLPSPSSVEASKVTLKPLKAAMEVAVSVAGFDPHRMLFLDDSERNIAAGKEIGFCTALVGKRAKTDEADFSLEGFLALKQVIPEIWGGKENEKKDGGERV